MIPLTFDTVDCCALKLSLFCVYPPHSQVSLLGLPPSGSLNGGASKILILVLISLFSPSIHKWSHSFQYAVTLKSLGQTQNSLLFKLWCRNYLVIIYMGFCGHPVSDYVTRMSWNNLFKLLLFSLGKFYWHYFYLFIVSFGCLLSPFVSVIIVFLQKDVFFLHSYCLVLGLQSLFLRALFYTTYSLSKLIKVVLLKYMSNCSSLLLKNFSVVFSLHVGKNYVP